VLETLADDCLFTEGPVWNPEGYYLFSDISGNCIYRISPGRKKEMYLENSGTSDADDPLIKKDQAGSNGGVQWTGL
jgi:gluconolactonase